MSDTASTSPEARPVGTGNAHYANLTASHIMTTYGRLPIAMVRGQGAYIWDADGKRYLDFLTGLAVCSLGHCHPKVVKAIQEQAATLIHCSNLYNIAKQSELAQKLTALSGLGKAFFCNSGAEANEGAIKLARKWSKLHHGPGRFVVVTATESFHGRTLATLAATGQTKYQDGFEPLPAGFRYAQYGDLASLTATIDDTVCAVMLEPVQGESGVHPAGTAYLQGVRKLCDDRGLLLIFDEVQTGIGRTGRMFAHQHSGVRPNIMTLAKALAGGVPIGCVLADDGTAAAFKPGNHASTFGGNPLACAAALAALEAIEEEGLVQRAQHLGGLMVSTVEGWKADPATRDCIGEVRGVGLMVGFDLRPGVDGGAVLAAAQAGGLLINSIAGKTIRLLPPLVLTDDEALAGLAILKAALQEASGGTGLA